MFLLARFWLFTFIPGLHGIFLWIDHLWTFSVGCFFGQLRNYRNEDIENLKIFLMDLENDFVFFSAFQVSLGFT